MSESVDVCVSVCALLLVQATATSTKLHVLYKMKIPKEDPKGRS